MKRKEWWEDAFKKGWYPLPNVVSDPWWQRKTREEIRFLQRLLRLSKKSRVLDIACGVGRHSIPLNRLGIDVVGVDVSPSYLEIARKNSKGLKRIKFLERDMRKIDFEGEFDAAINLFSSFGYFEKPSDDLRALKNISRALKPGGAFVLDIFNAGWVKANFKQKDWGELPDGTLVLESRELNEKKKVAKTRWIFASKKKRTEMNSSIRMYTLPWLSRVLRQAGFKKIRAYGNFKGERFHPTKSNRLLVVAEK